MQRISHRGHTLTWEEHSQGERTLIFINGYSANRTIWAREIGRLGRYGRCVSLDLPGHYPAEAPPGYRSLSQELLLDLELNAIRAIAGGGRATIVGHSTGGLVALAAAALLPETVDGVVALAPVVWGPLAGFLGVYQRMLGLPGAYGFYWLNYLATQRSLPYIRWGIGQFYSGDPAAYARNSLAAEIVRAWHPFYRQSSVRNFATLLRALRGCDIRALAARVACPTLVIAGSRDPVVPVAQARWLKAQLPGVELLEIPAAGHMVHWEAAAEVDAAIEGWLGRRG